MGDQNGLRTAEKSSEPRPDVVFSLMDGFVWASWPGTHTMIRLGAYDTVRAMMRDFLAQSEIGERMVSENSRNR